MEHFEELKHMFEELKQIRMRLNELYNILTPLNKTFDEFGRKMQKLGYDDINIDIDLKAILIKCDDVREYEIEERFLRHQEKYLQDEINKMFKSITFYYAMFFY